MTPRDDGYQGPPRERAEIDRIDHALIALLKERKEVADVIAGSPVGPGTTERFFAFMEDRRRWAVERGVDPAFVERVFAVISDSYFETRLEHVDQRTHLDSNHGPTA
jgi:chorismate mutase